jgi:hypothetical protein
VDAVRFVPFFALLVFALLDPLAFGSLFFSTVEPLDAPSLVLPVAPVLADASLLSLFVAALDALSADEDPSESLLVATFFLSPDLKSVSYQPPPFRRNATTEIFFFSRSFPHDGHRFSGASLIF